MSYESIVTHLRTKFNEGILDSFDKRKSQLQAFHKLVNENQDALCEAMWKDLHKVNLNFIKKTDFPFELFSAQN